MPELELLKPLREEHMTELSARIAAIQWLQQEASTLETQANRAAYLYNCLFDGWAACIKRGVSLDAPEELQGYLKIAEGWLAEYQTLNERRDMFARSQEKFQEALTLWLAEHYEFDPLKDEYELDLENCVLRKAARTNNTPDTTDTTVIHLSSEEKTTRNE